MISNQWTVLLWPTKEAIRLKMTRIFTLSGLSCANCASKIENAIQKFEWITSATVSLSTTRLRIELDKNPPKNVDKIIEKLVHTYEPDVVVSEKTESKRNHDKNHGTNNNHDSNRNPGNNSNNDSNNNSVKHRNIKLIWLIFGTLIYGTGIILEYFLDTGLEAGVDVSITTGQVATALFIISYILLTAKVLLRVARNIPKGVIFNEHFLMAVATLGAIAIGHLSEAVVVILFYQIGEFLQDMAITKSKKRISELMDIKQDYANLKIDGEIIKVDPEEVQIGDLFVVKPGEKIPLDGIVVDGEAMLDWSALTGESIPKKASESDTVLSGCINQNGVLTVQATKLFKDSTVSNILELVENAADKKAPTETFITKFTKYYTPVVVGSAALLATIPPLFFGGDWGDWIYRSLIFLIISCPCALVMSIPMGFFGGIGSASKKGILIKGGNYLEALANLDIVIFDKTGTLTEGIFKVADIQAANGFTEEELMEAAVHAETFSNHPIAMSIMKEYAKHSRNGKDATAQSNGKILSQYKEIAGHGVSVNVSGKIILAGNAKLMNISDITLQKMSSTPQGTVVYIAIDGIYAGSIVIRDEIKKNSHDLVANLKSLGIKKTVMLTGDTPQIAEIVAKELDIDEVHASLLPQEKVEIVEKIRRQKSPYKSLAFVGDGINDAPVLAMSDVGIAMGGVGSDAAIEAADVILMTDEPTKLIDAIKISRFTKRIVWQNIAFTLGVEVLFLILAALGIATLWEAIFADVGVALLAVLNSMRILQSR